MIVPPELVSREEVRLFALVKRIGRVDALEVVRQADGRDLFRITSFQSARRIHPHFVTFKTQTHMHNISRHQLQTLDALDPIGVKVRDNGDQLGGSSEDQ